MSLLRTLRIKEELGVALRFLRAQRGMTQGEVAERGGCTKATVSSYERGQKAPAFETLAAILTGLGCDLTDLQGALDWARTPLEIPEPIMPASLGPTLKSIRVARRETQSQVADRAGVTKAMVSAYEKGRQVPSLPVLDRLLEALEMNFAGLQREMRVEKDHRSHAVEATEAGPAADTRRPIVDLIDARKASLGLP